MGKQAERKTEFTITLDWPIQAHGETVSKITLRRPKGKHLRELDDVSGDSERALRLIGELADLPPASVDELDLADIMRISEAMERFFGISPQTGAR